MFQHQKRASSATLYTNRDELGIDRAKITVPRRTCYSDIVEAFVAFFRRAENVPVFRGTHNSSHDAAQLGGRDYALGLFEVREL